MKKEIKVVDRERGIVQVTVADGDRWYIQEVPDPETGLPSHEYVPSTMWILSVGYPKGKGLQKWIAAHGWDEAEALKAMAGDRGSAVHQAIGDLLAWKTVPMGASYVRPSTGEPAELTVDEYAAIMNFRDFYQAAQPRTRLHEHVVWSAQHGYAGTLDWVCDITAGVVEGIQGNASGVWLLDLKTGQDVWPEHELQVSAYRTALLEDTRAEAMAIGIGDVRLGILQVGYRRNKRGWKLTEVADQFPLFLAVKQIWKKETAGVEIFRAEYPLEISLDGAPTPPPQPAPKRRGRPRKAPAEQVAMGDA